MFELVALAYTNSVCTDEENSFLSEIAGPLRLETAFIAERKNMSKN